MFIVAGVFIVGLVAVKEDEELEEQNGGNKIFGIFLIFISEMCNSAFLTIEEKVLGDYTIDP